LRDADATLQGLQGQAQGERIRASRYAITDLLQIDPTIDTLQVGGQETLTHESHPASQSSDVKEERSEEGK
jgi:hypothetical protein